MSELTLKKEEHIKYIIDHFDFDEVNRVMNFLNWTWFNGEYYIPSINELESVATGLLNDVYDLSDDTSYIATGGFKASKCYDHLELEFIITDYSSEIINYGDRYEKLKKLKIRKKKLIRLRN